MTENPHDHAFRRCGWHGCTNATGGHQLCAAHASRVAGASHGNGNTGRLTDEQRAEIRRRMSRLEPPKAIAKSLGVTVPTIFRVMKAAK